MDNRTSPIMPKATAVWLIDNTTLTFKQIADFCSMHELEIRGIADGDVAQGIIGIDPIISGQLSRDELDRCVKDPQAVMRMSANVTHSLLAPKKKKPTKYTPVARRQDKPDAIYWLLKTCPEIDDAQITKLIGTTKTTIATIRDRSHWNMKNIRPRDPVLLGICSQFDLDKVLSKYQVSLGHVATNPLAHLEDLE